MNQAHNPRSPIPDLILPARDGGYSKGHDTREMILRGALELLIEEGYPAMSMRRVAVRCGIKFGNLTYHYRTREDLVRELLDAVISSYELAFAQEVQRPEMGAEERLRRYCDLVLDDIQTKKTSHLFPELWALSNHDAFVFDRMHDLYARARQPLAEILRDMRPDLAPEDLETLTLFISASMEGATIFAGHEKPFSTRMSHIKPIAYESFSSIIRHYKASTADPTTR